MGLFTRKDKASATRVKTSNPSSPIFPAPSQSSLRSPQTPRFHSNMLKIPLPKAPDPAVDPGGYLKSIGAVRERCGLVLNKARENKLRHFEVDMGKFADTTAFVVSIIKRDFAPNYASIPPHGRWQHFNVGGRDRIAEMMNSWPASVDPAERCRRLLDLFLVSVLLDAGAGNTWTYKSTEGDKVYKRSEGLAVATLEMFKSGMFSSDCNQAYQVDAMGLKSVNLETLAKGLQVSETNLIAGLEGRTGLLINLSTALLNTDLFGKESRPGHMLDYLLSHPTTQASSVPVVLLPTLWSVLTDGLGPIWPSSRTQIDGRSIGDAWPLSMLATSSPAQQWETIVPFHKLSQWLCYSLMQPMAKLMNIYFAGAELMTGLAEYRNGGLFIDTGVLTLKKDDVERGLKHFHENSQREGKRSVEVVPMFKPEDDVIVEWRAVTVGFLDLLCEEVNSGLRLQGTDRLSLVQMLEAGSWKGGREMAEISRPNTQCPPIAILSDGTVF